jgi:microcystin-dependent protein
MKRILSILVFALLAGQSFGQEPFLAEIRVFPFNFAPKNWAQCNGQLLPITQNQALFALLGTTYGGDGRITFALPDFRDRMAVGMGQGPGLSNYTLGQRAGEATVTLQMNTLPTHSHSGTDLDASFVNFRYLTTNTTATSDRPEANYYAINSVNAFNPTSNVVMAPGEVSCTSDVRGGNQPHENMMPYLALNYCIAMQGVFPSHGKSAKVKKGGGSSNYIGEIIMFAGNFPPTGWAFCAGQILPIAQNTALFSLLGTMYGGNGTSTFALPDLRSRVPISYGQGPGLSYYDIGQTGGEEIVTLLLSEIPMHSHTMAFNPRVYNSAGNSASPAGNYPAIIPLRGAEYGTTHESYLPQAGTKLDFIGQSIGSGLPHNNMQPYLTINYIIALQGIYPQRP